MSILDRLSYGDKRIFDIELSEDRKTIKFTEACDRYFEDRLSRDELLALIKELQDISDNMEPT